jgi:hypothetical protein
LMMPRVPWPSAWLPLPAGAGWPLLIRGISRGGTIGIVRALVQAGLEGCDPRFKGVHLLCLLLGHREQLDDQLPHDEGRLLPAGCIQRQPFWQRDGGDHDTPLRAPHLAAASVIDAAVRESNPEKCQHKMGGRPPWVT